MWSHIFPGLFMVQVVICSNYYPYQQQFFAHQSQSLFQGQSGLQFGFPPGVFSRPVNSIQGSAGGQVVINGNTGIQGGGHFVINGGDPSNGGGGGQGIFISGPPGNGQGGNEGGAIFIPNGVQGSNGGGNFVSPGAGWGIQGGNNGLPIFIPGGGFQGGNGWSPYPPQPNPIPWQKPPCCDNNLKPSITGWDTSYTVPCGTYNIYPFVTARIRHTAGSHSAEKVAKSLNSTRQGRSYFPYYQLQNSPPTSCSWNFNAAGCKLKFSCSYLQLPALFQCDENVMEYNDTLKYFKYCGSSSRKVHEPLISESGHLKVTFKSRAHALPSVINCSVICTPEFNFPELSTHVLVNVKPQSKPEPKPEPKPLKLGKCKCGVRRTVSTGRIVGGKRTSPGEFPWTVALVKKNSNRPFCGGSLINNQFILTAAHCVQTRKPNQKAEGEIEVLLNEHDVTKVNAVPGGKVRGALKKILIHPKYDKITYDHDIALLQLEKSIDFEAANPKCSNGTKTGFARMENEFDAQFIPVCLPFNMEKEDLPNREAIVTGWGLTQEGGTPSNAMMQAPVTIFNDTACKGFYETTDVITEQMMCVGHPEGKVDSCVGDSGGPLVINEKETYTLAGIVSWGRGCGRPNLPGVYTRMIGLTDWVTEHANDGVWCGP